MRKAKVGTHSTINNFIDAVTGEILDTQEDVKHHKIAVTNKDMFFMWFAEVSGIIDNLDRVEMTLIHWCGTNASYNENMVNLTKPACDMITKKHGIGYGTIKNAVSRLAKKKILIPLGSGTYRVNPRYFWKGDTKNRTKTMNFILEVECEDC